MVVEFNILFAFLTQIIFLTHAYGKSGSIAAISLLSLFCFLYILLILFIIARDFRRKERFLRKHSKSEFLTNLLANALTAVSGLMYLVGNHMSLIFQYHYEWYQCDDTCRDLGTEIASTFLITAILLFRLIPTFVNKVKILSDHAMGRHRTSARKKPDISSWSPWRTTAQALGFTLELDAWFTAVSDLPLQSQEYCPKYSIDLAWGTFVIGMIVWATLLIVILIPGIINLYQEEIKETLRIIQFCLVCLNFLALWIVTAVFLLTDNIQPLGCAFGCHTEDLRNQTISNFQVGTNDIICHYDALHSTRLVVLLLVLIYYTAASIALVFHSWRKYHAYKNQTYSMHIQATAVNSVATVKINSDV